jgi:hypothetical protein
MARNARDLPTGDPAIVVTNPEVDASPEAFRRFISELLETEPEFESIGAAEALRELRSDS